MTLHARDSKATGYERFARNAHAACRRRLARHAYVHDPTMAAQSIVALDAPAGDAIDDAPAPEVRPAARKVVALVRMQLARPAARSAALSSHIGQGIDQLLEDHRVVPVGAGDAEHQRDALAVRDEVALAAEFAPVGRVGARVRAPRGLGTLAASRLARLKSSLPALRSSASSSRCRRCHTPASCHWRRRCQHVMPLPKPSSCGSSSQGMPVRSTNRMPLSAISSLTRERPPLAEGTNTGSTCGCRPRRGDRASGLPQGPARISSAESGSCRHGSARDPRSDGCARR